MNIVRKILRISAYRIIRSLKSEPSFWFVVCKVNIGGKIKYVGRVINSRNAYFPLISFNLAFKNKYNVNATIISCVQISDADYKLFIHPKGIQK